MSSAPENIAVFKNEPCGCNVAVSIHEPHLSNSVFYRRADLPPTAEQIASEISLPEAAQV